MQSPFILNKVLAYTSPKTIFNARLADSTCLNNVDSDLMISIIKERIEKRLRIIFLDQYDNLVQAMSESKSIISGSFIIQCILDERWLDSDIDIYVGVKNHVFSDEKNYLIMDKFLTGGINSKDYLQGVHNGFVNYTNYFSSGLGHRIRDVRNFLCPNESTELQLVVIQLSEDYSLQDHVFSTGFEACKNYFSFNSDGSINLVITNLKEIMYRVTTYTILSMSDFLYRLRKYGLGRGFRFKSKYNPALCLEYFLVNKYFSSNDIRIISNRFSEECYRKYVGTDKRCHAPLCDICICFPHIRHFHQDLRLSSHIFSQNEIIYFEEDFAPYFKMILGDFKENNRVKKNNLYTYHKQIYEKIRTICKRLEINIPFDHINDWIRIRKELTHNEINIYNNESGYPVDLNRVSRVIIHKNKVARRILENKVPINYKPSTINTTCSWAEHLKKLNNSITTKKI